ncbi:HU family DNA-binding protein [Calditrichota bacterium]
MENKVNFTDLVDKIAQETGASKKLVHDLLIESVNVTKEGLDRDGLVIFRGLGRFLLKWHESRPGRNPQTGEEIEIAAHSSVNYRPEAELREFINREYAHLKPQIIKDKDEIKPVQPQEIPVTPKEEIKPDIKKEIPVEPKEEMPPPVSEAPMEIREEKKKSYSWLWILILLLIVILIYFFWPSTESTKIDKQEIAATEQVSEESTVQPEKEIPAEKPAEPVAEKPVIAEKKAGTLGGEHTVKPGQNLWKISQDFYNEANLWPNIYRVNLNLKNPNVLTTGNTIQVPDLQGKPGSLTNKDIQNIAEGFMEVYLVYKNQGREDANYFLWVVKKWNTDQVINKYKDKIDAKDLELVENITGSPIIK